MLLPQILVLALTLGFLAGEIAWCFIYIA